MTPVAPVTASSPRRASARAGAGPLGPAAAAAAVRVLLSALRCRPAPPRDPGAAPARGAAVPAHLRDAAPHPPKPQRHVPSRRRPCAAATSCRSRPGRGHRPRSPCPRVTHAAEPAPPEPPSAPTLGTLPGTASALGASGEEDPVRKAFRLLQKVRNVEGITKMWRRGAKEQTPRPGRRGASTERGPRGGQAPSHRKRTRQHHGVGVGTKRDPLPS